MRSINLEVKDKEFVTLLGPSGCGKTTTLRIIGGFETPAFGDLYFEGKRINDLPPYKRKVNTIFQKYALFPHLNVFENVAFGLRIARLPEKEIRDRVFEMLELVNLRGFERRSSDTLSGGQQQRVAIARALVCRPRVLLLDEPLGAPDLRLRKDMQVELKRIQRQLEITFIYVTRPGGGPRDKRQSCRYGQGRHPADWHAGGHIQRAGKRVCRGFYRRVEYYRRVMIDDYMVEFCNRRFKCVDAGFGKRTGRRCDTPEDIDIIPYEIGHITAP